MRIALCTLHTPEVDAYAKYTTLNFRNYCNLHRYSYIDSNISLDLSRPCQWSKVKLIEKILNGEYGYYDWILWIDSDAVITNKNIKIEDIIGLYGNGIYDDFIIAKEDCCDLTINAGILLVKNSEWSKNFLKIWYNQVQYINSGWLDNSALIYLQQYDTDARNHIKLVKQRVMNSFMDAPSRAGQEGIWKEGDFIIHFAGYANRDALKWLAYYGDVNYVPTREHIPELLNKLGLFGQGIEIGVQKGIYSESILSRSRLSKLYLCDSWRYLEDYRSIANIDNQNHEKCFIETQQRLIRFKDRTEMLRMLSQEAVKLFKDESLDFVYIDANHKYGYVMEDLKNWYPKVKKGGIIAGHDFLDGDLPEETFGVCRAVTEFFKNASCVYVTDEDWPSWYVIKE